MTAQTAALICALGLVLIAVFQAALAAGAPLGRAAWGGAHTRLPRNLRIGSVVAMVIWLAAAVVVLERAGVVTLGIPDVVTRAASWILVGVLILGAAVNVASSSPYERFGWAPFSLVTALLVLIVAFS